MHIYTLYIYIHISSTCLDTLDCRYDFSKGHLGELWGAPRDVDTSLARKWRWQKPNHQAKTTNSFADFPPDIHGILLHHGISLLVVSSGPSPPLLVAFPSFKWPGSVRCQAAWGAKPRDSRASNSSGGPERSETWLKNGPRFSRISAPGIDKTLEFMTLLMNSILFIRLLVFVGMRPKFMGDTSFRECQESNTSTALGKFHPLPTSYGWRIPLLF